MNQAKVVEMLEDDTGGFADFGSKLILVNRRWSQNKRVSNNRGNHRV
jgi:hypothetical protein